MKFTKILRRQKTLRITLRKTPSSGRTLKVPFLVKNALGKFLGYFFENLGYFFTKLSGLICGEVNRAGIIYDGYVKASKLFHAQRARILKKICCPNLSNGVGLFLSLFRGRTSSDRNIVRN